MTTTEPSASPSTCRNTPRMFSWALDATEREREEVQMFVILRQQNINLSKPTMRHYVQIYMLIICASHFYQKFVCRINE